MTTTHETSAVSARTAGQQAGGLLLPVPGLHLPPRVEAALDALGVRAPVPAKPPVADGPIMDLRKGDVPPF